MLLAKSARKQCAVVLLFFFLSLFLPLLPPDTEIAAEEKLFTRALDTLNIGDKKKMTVPL